MKHTGVIHIDDAEKYESLPVCSRKTLKSFGWYGGKLRKLDFILPLLPECDHYVEPFGGSAAVLLNRKPSKIETYNDIYGEVVNFFRVLRDHPDELKKVVDLTPYSREEYFYACYEQGETDIERARKFLIRVYMAWMSLAQTAKISDWIVSLNPKFITSKKWDFASKDFYEVSKRFKRVQLENRPAIDIITKYDRSETLFYCDPPYFMETRTSGHRYAYEMDTDQYVEFASVVNNCKGKVAISGYDHPFLDELFTSSKWRKVYDKERFSSSTRGKGKRTDVLWMNYDIDKDKSTLL